MRGADISQPSLFITKTVEDFVPKGHPLRAIRKLVDQALSELDGKLSGLYADEGRTSIAPERLIRASLLPEQRCRCVGPQVLRVTPLRSV